ncbi:MAG: hypothetical protein ABW221_03370 [Vicinamibacteria bacterium]
MAVKTIKGQISDDEESVTLSGEPDARPPLTFLVKRDDVLRWDFTGVPPRARTRVAFSSSEPDVPVDPVGVRHLFADGDSSKGASHEAGPDRKTRIESGPVLGLSSPGKYFYKVFLIRPSGEIELRCLWDGRPTAMGGGEKSGKPEP